MPSHPSSRKAQFRLIPEEPALTHIYELGCVGAGSHLSWLRVTLMPGWWVSKSRFFHGFLAICAVILKAANLEIRRADFLRCDLSMVIPLCYLMVAPMRILKRKLMRELRPGSCDHQHIRLSRLDDTVETCRKP